MWITWNIKSYEDKSKGKQCALLLYETDIFIFYVITL